MKSKLEEKILKKLRGNQCCGGQVETDPGLVKGKKKEYGTPRKRGA